MGRCLYTAIAAALLLVLGIGSVSPIVSASCPDRPVLTTNCSAVCPSVTVCVLYSSSVSTRAERAIIGADANGCVFRCLDATVDPLAKTLRVTIPASDPAVQDMAALTLPANVTGLDLTSDATASQTLGFPGGNIVANGTLLNYLGLHNISLDALPMAVYDLPLATLRLQLSASSLPASTSRFKTINTLMLDGGGLTAFPSSQVIGDMPQVRTLSLTANAITEIRVDDTTTQLYAASALQELALGDNKLAAFGAAFFSLHVLDLHGNQLTALPTSLSAMAALEELRLDGNPLDAARVATQLAELKPLSELKRLNLSSCGLTALLPTGFAKVFTGLTHLDLAQNGLAAVAAGALPDESLVFVNVSANKLTSFAGSFQALTTLDVSRNQLASLSATLSASLVRLLAASNALVSLNVSGLTNLEVLDLSDNKLAAFPAIWDVPKLSVLRLRGNPSMAPLSLTRDQFVKLEGLTELAVDATAFSSKACASDRLVTSKHGISICVVPATGESAQPTQDEPPATTTTSKPTSTVDNASSRVAGVITTLVLVVCGLVFGAVAHVRRQRDKRQQQQLALNHLDHSRGGRMGELVPYHGDAVSPSRPRKHTASSDRCAKALAPSTVSSSTAPSSSIQSAVWHDDALLPLRVAMDSIRFFKVVGMGAHGQVWRGTCRTSTTESRHVAIKTLAPELARDRATVAAFIAQVQLQASLQHPRLVAVVGVAWSTPLDLCALLEFMPRGDLFATLHYSSSSSCSSSSTLFQPGVWSASKLQIALDIVAALQFLHAQSPPVFHRDLKSRNVLLDMHGRAKLSDVRIQSSSTAAITSPLWTAPEVIAGRGVYSAKADIFSFGVILSELDTHEIPYGYDGSATTMLESATHGRNASHTHARQLLLRQISLGEIRPTFRRSCPPALLAIAQQCLAHDPTQRPSAMELQFLLRRMERDDSDGQMPALD